MGDRNPVESTYILNFFIFLENVIVVYIHHFQHCCFPSWVLSSLFASQIHVFIFFNYFYVYICIVIYICLYLLYLYLSIPPHIFFSLYTHVYIYTCKEKKTDSIEFIQCCLHMYVFQTDYLGWKNYQWSYPWKRQNLPSQETLIACNSSSKSGAFVISPTFLGMLTGVIIVQVWFR